LNEKVACQAAGLVIERSTRDARSTVSSGGCPEGLAAADEAVRQRPAAEGMAVIYRGRQAAMRIMRRST
jgi:hypothetical protein